jgi:Cellulase (glycosyl hydrolase family 5)
VWSAPSTDSPRRRLAPLALVAALVLGGAAQAQASHWSSADELASRGGFQKRDLTPPSTPAGLTLTQVTATTLSLSWQPSRDDRRLKGYVLYRDGAYVGTRSRTSAKFRGLGCGRTYRLAVAALDAAGNRSEVASLSASTSSCPDTVAPTPPSNVIQTGAAATTISVFWSAALDEVGVAGYGVYRDGVRVGTATATSYVVGSLACGKSYQIGVDSFDAAGNRSPITNVFASTSPCPVFVTVPPQPASPAPTAPRTTTSTTTAAATTTTATTTPTPTTTTVPLPTLPNPVSGKCPVGVNQGIFWRDEREWTQLDAIAQGGVKLLRTDFNHGSVERQRGVFDWSRYDRFVAATRARGIKHIATIAYSARWNAPGGNEKAEPLDHAAYAAFAREVVRRYGADLAAVEIWNEPWLEQFWAQPNPVAYARLARRTADEIRSVNGTIPILVSADETPVWYSSVLAADPTLAALDLSVHVYSEDRPPDDARTELRWRYDRWTQSRDIARRYGNADPGIWLTELGWSSANLGEQRQAEYMRKALERGCGEWKGQVEALVVYGWFADMRTSWWDGYGLLRSDSSAKPAWLEIARAAS